MGAAISLRILAFVLTAANGTRAPTSVVGPEAAKAADAAIARGLEHLRRDEYEDAFREFLEGRRLFPTPRATAEVGLAEQALRRFPDAEKDLVDALAAADDAWVRRHRADLEASLGEVRDKLASIDVQGNPPDAEVRLGGHPVGIVPFLRPVRWPAGSVTVDVRSPGYLPYSKTIEIRSQGITSIWADLAPVSSRAPPPLAAVPPAVVAGKPGVDRASTAVPEIAAGACTLVGALTALAGIVAVTSVGHERLGMGLIVGGAGAAVAGGLGMVFAALNDGPETRERDHGTNAVPDLGRAR